MYSFSKYPTAALLLILGLVSFSACQKEVFSTAAKPATQGLATESRAANGDMVGVSLKNGTNPSQLVIMNDVTGVVTSAVNVFWSTYQLTDLKGVCYANNRYIICNDADPTDPFTVAFYEVNLNGQATHMYDIPNEFGVISDIDYDANKDVMYGLADNSNSLVAVNNFFAGPVAADFVATNITGLAKGFTAQGLAIIEGTIYVAASSPSATTNLYSVDPATGAATLVGALGPAGDLQGGHSGIGYDSDFNRFLINRGATATSLGLNRITWPLPGGGNITADWGADDYDFEDLITYP